MRYQPAVILFSWLMLVTAACHAADLPRWKFAEGDSLDYVVQQSQTMKADAGLAGSLDSSMAQTTKLNWLVESVDEAGNARIKQTIRAIQIESDSAMGEITFDSESKDPPQGLAAMLAPSLRAMIELPCTATVSPTGNVTDLNAPEELLETLNKVSGAGGAMPSAETLRQLYAVIAMPTDESAPTEKDQPPPTVRLFFGDAEEHKVNGQSLVVLKPTLKRVEQENPAMEINAAVAIGEAMFDRELGRLVKLYVKQTMEVSVTVQEEVIDAKLEQAIVVKSE